MQPAVFLDRDGVINEAKVIDGKPYPPNTLAELKIIEGVKDSLSLLRDYGYYCIVITNQPDVARGKTPIETVEEINRFLLTNLAIDEILSCYHDDNAGCQCRKPKPGAILNAAKKYDIDLKGSYMIGDRWRDIEAGQGAGCDTFFIDYQYNEKRPANPTYTVNSLSEAVKIILGNKKP